MNHAFAELVNKFLAGVTVALVCPCGKMFLSVIQKQLDQMGHRNSTVDRFKKGLFFQQFFELLLGDFFVRLALGKNATFATDGIGYPSFFCLFHHTPARRAIASLLTKADHKAD